MWWHFFQRYDRLVRVSNGLFELMSQKGLSQIIITRHISDVLAGFIQLSFAQLKKPTASTATATTTTTTPSNDDNSTNDGSSNSDDFVMTPEMYETLKQHQAEFEEKLKAIIEKVIFLSCSSESICILSALTSMNEFT